MRRYFPPVYALLSVALLLATETSLSREAGELNQDDEAGLLEINIDQEIIQRAAELASPFRIKGIQKTPVGAMKWTAIITNPTIRITEEGATFEADVLIDAGVIKLQQKMAGNLEPQYLEKQNRIIVKPVNVKLKARNKNQGPIQGFGNLNMNGMIPDIEIPVSLPKP